jgi:hypothetical protein
MKLKQLPLAIFISGLILLFEFKVLPYVIDKARSWNKQVHQPIQQTEVIKTKLVNSLRENDIKIINGPKTKPEINGLETLIKREGEFIKVIFSTQQPPQTQLASLQLILKEAKIDEGLNQRGVPKLIDLTGDKPYVAF